MLTISAQLFGDLLQVPVSTANNTITGGGTGCGSEVVYPPHDLLYGIPESDLHIYVALIDDPTQNYTIYGTSCTLNTYYRPNIGKIVFNWA
jgi:hypothetical protein